MNTAIRNRLKKLEGRLHIKKEFTAEDHRRIAAWRKGFHISDSTSDEQIYEAMQTPFTEYIREINRKQRERKTDEQHN